MSDPRWAEPESVPEVTVLYEWTSEYDKCDYRMVMPASRPLPGQMYELQVRPPGRSWMPMRDWNEERR